MSKSEKCYLVVHNRLGPLYEEPEKRLEPLVSTWSPPVDIFETPEDYIVTAEVPGMTPEDFKITAGTNWLSLRGDRKSESICNQENYYRLECVHGRFHRCFEFSEEIDPQAVTAALADGILEVQLGKASAR